MIIHFSNRLNHFILFLIINSVNIILSYICNIPLIFKFEKYKRNSIKYKLDCNLKLRINISYDTLIKIYVIVHKL